LTDREVQKRAAAERAVALLESGMRVGLGTGSTARHVVALLGERLRTGELSDIVAVATSRATEAQAREVRIPLATLDEVPRLDLTIDGADEIDPVLNLIKGLGGALLWEKIVARASARLVIVADDSKEVARLGTRAPLPVEIVPFGWRTHEGTFERLGARAVLRRDADGAPFVTDGRHYIVDLHFADGIDEPATIEAELLYRSGIVDTGLFLDMATAAVLADAGGVRVRARDTR
jgi:ribose 5-phosphate isomerase A